MRLRMIFAWAKMNTMAFSGGVGKVWSLSPYRWTLDWGYHFKPSKAYPQMCPQCSNPLEVNGVPQSMKRQK
jgi:hypothetical protein